MFSIIQLYSITFRVRCISSGAFRLFSLVNMGQLMYNDVAINHTPKKEFYMLKPLRNKKVMKAVMWLLVIIFAAWGVGSVALSGKSYAGIVFGKKISLQEYNKSYASVLNRARIMYGDELAKVEKFLNLNSQAWDRIILLRAGAKERIKVPNQQVIERIAALPFFQRNGVFDKDIYNYITTSVLRVTPRDFEESVRGDIIIDKLIYLKTDGAHPSEDEIRQAYIKANQLADISFIVIKDNMFLNEVSIHEAQAKAYYEKHKKELLTPATAGGAYLEFPFNDDKEDAAFAANSAWVKIKKGETLDGIAKEFNLQLKDTGIFPVTLDISSTDIPYPLVLASFGLEKSKVSDVIEGKDRFYILQLGSKKASRRMTFDEARDSVNAVLTDEIASSLSFAQSQNIMNKMQSQTKSLEDMAKESNLSVNKLNNVSRNSQVDNMTPAKDFLNESFAVEAGKTAGPIKIPGGWAISRLDSITPLDEESYKRDRDSFASKLTREKENEVFKKWFQEIKQKANLKENL